MDNQGQGRRQAAEVTGHGNLVVQIAGDGNVANLASHLPALSLKTYDSPLFALGQRATASLNAPC